MRGPIKLEDCFQLFVIGIQHKSVINSQREHLIKFYSSLIKIYSRFVPVNQSRGEI